MEIAVGADFPIDDYRVIHGGCELTLGDSDRVCDRIAETASDLRRTTYGIGVLHLSLLEIFLRGLQQR